MKNPKRRVKKNDHGAYEAWFATNPRCPVCNKKLTTSHDSFRTCMKRLGRPPIHCRGHNPQKKERKYLAEYEEFLTEKHLCACGCGEILQPSYGAFVAAMVDYGRGPLRKQNHHKNKMHDTCKKQKKENNNRIKLNGCTLIRADHGRCEKSYNCEHYESCLSATESRHWGGWKLLKENV